MATDYDDYGQDAYDHYEGAVIDEAFERHAEDAYEDDLGAEDPDLEYPDELVDLDSLDPEARNDEILRRVEGGHALGVHQPRRPAPWLPAPQFLPWGRRRNPLLGEGPKGPFLLPAGRD